jgi:hypothetical protein
VETMTERFKKILLAVAPVAVLMLTMAPRIRW